MLRRIEVVWYPADSGADAKPQRIPPYGPALFEAAPAAAEARRAELAPHPDSMDLCFQGMACVNKGWTPE